MYTMQKILYTMKTLSTSLPYAVSGIIITTLLLVNKQPDPSLLIVFSLGGMLGILNIKQPNISRDIRYTLLLWGLVLLCIAIIEGLQEPVGQKISHADETRIIAQVTLAVITWSLGKYMMITFKNLSPL